LKSCTEIGIPMLKSKSKFRFRYQNRNRNFGKSKHRNFDGIGIKFRRNFDFVEIKYNDFRGNPYTKPTLNTHRAKKKIFSWNYSITPQKSKWHPPPLLTLEGSGRSRQKEGKGIFVYWCKQPIYTDQVSCGGRGWRGIHC
jgi:hypothetical protein